MSHIGDIAEELISLIDTYPLTSIGAYGLSSYHEKTVRFNLGIRNAEQRFTPPDGELHRLTIEGGTIDGNPPVMTKLIPAGSVMQISAFPGGAGEEFVIWQSADGVNVFGDRVLPQTTFLMLDHDIAIRAVFRASVMSFIKCRIQSF